LKEKNFHYKSNFNFQILNMAKNKGPRIVITLECSECRQNDNKRSAGVSRYLSSKNRRNTPDKLEISKYCRYCNRHTIHKETK
jgi:large subunit ribosomal protein L33